MSAEAEQLTPADAAKLAREAPIGSRWYAWGHHWEITEHGLHDGEPAVYKRCLTGKPGAASWVILDKLMRWGEPSQSKREEVGMTDAATPTKAKPKGKAKPKAAEAPAQNGKAQQAPSKPKAQPKASKPKAQHKSEAKPKAASRSKLPPLPETEEELLALMAPHKAGAKLYDKAHFALKEDGLSEADRKRHEAAKERNRKHQNAYWRAYNALLALRKAQREEAK